ncbi:MAG TPA: hypothetical protein VF773_08670 [Verrucomicrobiae bacterium]
MENLSKVVEQTTGRLLDYCKSNDWAGYDPYDALNSRILRSSKLYNLKLVRLILTQGLKRSPINVRPLLRVPKSHNPKGIALFLSSLTKLSSFGAFQIEPSEVARLGNLLLDLRSPGEPYSTWGYSFDWQTRTELIPKGSPNIICTTFAANALLDAYAVTRDERYSSSALRAAKFVFEELYTEERGVAWFNYTRLEKTQIHNANLLGAALLCRVSSELGESDLLEAALKATRFTVERQNPDGSWFYGEREQPSQKWIDNFHTGFNLCALHNIGKFAATSEFEPALQSGLSYFIDTFIDKDGAPKYFHNKKYPIDVHSAAQTIVTLELLQAYDQRCISVSDSVLKWTLTNLWNGKNFFYYQKFRFGKNKVPYIRWSQAWMLLALSFALRRLEGNLGGLADPQHLATARSVPC